MFLPEVLLWTQIRRGGLEGFKFRRQHAIGPFVLDFFCASAKLAVEVDGASHYEPGRQRRDADRDSWLARYGIRTLRLPASAVLSNMNGSLEMILINVRKSGETGSTAPS